MNDQSEYFDNDLKYLCDTLAVPNTLLKPLQTAKITTFEEILLTKATDLNNNSNVKIDAKQLCELQQIISDYYNSSVQINNLQTIINNNTNTHKKIKYYSTTINKLDSLISDKNIGIPTQSITNFTGSPSSGKTLILYQISANCLLNNGNVIFIDCNNINQFNGKRFYSIIKGIASKNNNNNNNNNEKIEELIEMVMRKMYVYSVCSLDEMIKLFDKDSFINKIKTNNIDMIMIDNMGLNTYLYELNQTFYCHGEIVKISKKLKYFAIKYNLSVITSSLSVGKNSENEFWIHSTGSQIYKNWYNFIDNEIHLLLMTTFGCVRPILTKSRKNITYRDNGLFLKIDQIITGDILPENK